jgi:electron transport complex protein RnfG
VVVIKGKISDIRVLENEETPRYLDRAMYGLKDKWVGKSISKAYKIEVDAVSGATYTSEAIISNMKLALEELQKK